MGQRDDAMAVQNRFTAYLLIALKHKKRDYIVKQERFQNELPTDFQSAQFADDSTYGMVSSLPFPLQIEDDRLMDALGQLTAKERYILFERVLNDCGYDELADSLNLRYSGAASAYNRIIQKLRKALRGGRK